MKKVIACILAAVMTGAMAITAFAGEGGSVDYAFDRSWPEEELKLAMAVYDTTDEQFLAMREYNDYLEQNFNIKFIYSESLSDAEQELAFVDAAASAGCKAYFGYYNMAETETIKQAQAHGMFYVGGVSGVGYEQKPELGDFDNYVGSYVLASDIEVEGEHNGDYLGGYALGYSMANKGYQHIAYCEGGAAFGVQMFIDRKEGFLDGLQAAGYDHFTDADLVSGWPGTDEFAAQQTAVISGDYDAVVSSFNVAMWFQPVMESGKQIGLAAIGEANETYKDFFDMGVVQTVVYDCEETVFGVFLPMAINAALGYEDMAKMDGHPVVTPVTRWTITEAEQIDAIYDYHEAGNFFVSAEDFAQTLKGLNPNATVETYEEVFNLTLDEALAKIQ